MSETSSVDVPPSRLPVMAYAVLLAVAAGLAFALASLSKLTIFSALAALSGWAALVTVARLIPPLRFHVRRILVGGLALALVVTTAKLFYTRPVAVAGAPLNVLQLATVTMFVLAFVLHFAANYGSHVARADPRSGLPGLLPLVRLASAAHALAGVALLLRLYTTKNILPAASAILAVTVLLLAVEALVRAVAALYQPKRLRGRATIVGESVLLPALFGEAGPLRSLAATVEKSLGMKLGDAWLVRLARLWLAPLVLLGILGVIASTAVTRIPVDGHGVLIERGKFSDAALAPGLHFHLPWPWARVEVVPTERIQEIALGFERDLDGPVLWAEKHFDGEQNLLVGQGEELLTVNAPVQYRIRDAVTYLRNAGDARTALTALGYRRLLALTTRHTSFGLMTTDRGEISESLRDGLQADCDRLRLGLEIVFVGLKDVHPPVAVTPAYQDVESAEEERLTTYDRAVTETVNMLTDARTESAQRRLQAETFATEKRSRALGDAARFLAPLPIYREYSEVFATRVRLETLEAVLAPVRQLLVLPASQRAKAHLYLSPDGSGQFPTLVR